MTYAPAHTVLAVLYETIGELGLAEEEYLAAVKYDPRDGDINNNYGAFLCRIGKGKDAEPVFSNSCKGSFLPDTGGCLLECRKLYA